MVILSPLSLDDFKNILQLYNIGFYKSHKHISHALGNTVYFLETNKSKYILKIFEDSNENSILEQLKIMDYLSQKKVPVGNNIHSRTNKELIIYKKGHQFYILSHRYSLFPQKGHRLF